MVKEDRARTQADARDPLLGQTESVAPRVCDPLSDDALDALVHQASASAGWTERNARYLLDKVDELLTVGTWPRRLPNEPRTWERFCDEVLGYDAAYIEHIREGVLVLQSHGVHSPTVRDALTARQIMSHQQAGQRGGRGKKASDNVTSFRRGNRADYTKARLKRERGDLYQQVLEGELSAHAAAIAAGFRTRNVYMPLVPERAADTLIRHMEPTDLMVLVRLLQAHLVEVLDMEDRV